MKKTNGHRLNIAFFGTPRFATRVLSELEQADLTPALIVTAPDKPRGRGLKLTPPEAKRWAEERGIDVLQPEKLGADTVAELNNSEWDMFVVAAYGKILPKALLNIPKRGVLNVHPSLLPRWRGPSPIQAAILEDNEAGVTIMLVGEKVDEGPILAQARVAVDKWPPRGGILSDLLATEGGKLLVEVIPLWVAKNIVPEEQDHANATYSKKIGKENGLIDLADDPRRNFRKIQAYDLWPGAYFFAEQNGKRVRVKITDAALENGELIIKEVIPEGKREMPYSEFTRNSS